MKKRPADGSMAALVGSERETLLTSGDVAGGDALRGKLIGDASGSAHAPGADAGHLPVRQLLAANAARELDDSDELSGTRDAYDAAQAGMSVRRMAERRRAGKAAAKDGAEAREAEAAAARAPSKPGPPSAKAKSAAAADPDIQAARIKAKGAAGAAKASAPEAGGAVAEVSARTVANQAAKSGGAAAAASAAETTAGVAGALAGAGAPVAGVVAGVVAFVLTALLVGQIVSALFGFWENEADRQLMEGLPPYITYEMVEAALDAQERYGHPAGCTIAKIICESGQGDTMSRLATRDHNLFGMKWSSAFASAPEVRGKASWATGEEAADGSRYTITAHFIVFKGDAECIKFRSRVFLQASRYAQNPLIREAIAKHDSDKMAEGLKAAGWATSSSYVESLKSIMGTYDLYRFDGLSLEDFKAGEESGNVIVAAAYSQLGVPYVWGGSTPGKALDCSGLTQYCYRQAGIRISHYTETQKSELRRIPISQAKPGDILYKYGHVAIYIGGDKYIHEPHTGDVCRIASGTSYFTCALSARADKAHYR